MPVRRITSALFAWVALVLFPIVALAQGVVPAARVPTRPANDNSLLPANTAYVDAASQVLLNAIGTRAPLASPLFTGIVTAPKLSVTGSGSTGDVSGMSVAFPSLATRTLLDRLVERPSVVDYGVDMTGVADSTATFAAALNSGRRVSAPCGTIRLVSTVTVAAPALFDGPGPCLTLRYDAPAGAPITPILDIKPSAVGTSLDNFAFDHGAATRSYANPTIYGGDIIAGSAILVQADGTSITRYTGRDGWDNCIAVNALKNGTTEGVGAVSGKPVRYSIRSGRTSGCGRGTKAGAGVDIGSGAFGIVDDLVDNGSYAAFIQDIGAGAQGTFSNLTGVGNACDYANTGFRCQAFYIGAGNSTYVNLTSFDSQDRGIWIDAFTPNTTIANLVIKAPKSEAMVIKSDKINLTGVNLSSIGYGSSPGAYDAIVVDTSTQAVDLVMTNLTLRQELSQARSGIAVTGGNALTGGILNADLSGAATPVAASVPRGFSIVDRGALGGGWTDYTPTVTCDSGSPTVGNASGSARRVGKTVEVQFNVTLSAYGSCGGSVIVGLPYVTRGRATVMGRETSKFGVGLTSTVFENTAQAKVVRTDGSVISSGTNGDGVTLTMGGTYQTP